MGLLRRRDFLLLFTSFALSSFGDYLALLALTIRVHDSTGSGWAVSALVLTQVLPLVAFAPLVGLLVDRLETVSVLAVTAVAQAAVALILAFTAPLPAVLALSFVLGVGFAVTQPALFALVPTVSGEETTEANAYLEVARWGGAAAGPLAAGTLTAALGYGAALVADALTFCVVALAVVALSVRRPPAEERFELPAGQPRRREAREGITVLLRDRVLGLVVVAMAAMVLFIAMDNVAEVFFAKRVLGAGDTGYAALVSGWTIGMVAAATLVARRVPATRLAPAVLASSVVGGGAVIIAAGFPSFALALPMFFVGGGANGIENVGIRSLIHHRVPARVQGRVFAAYYGLVNGASIAATILGGALVAATGARVTLLLAGSGGVAVGVLGLFAYLRLRDRGAVPAAAPAAATLPRA